MPGRLLAASTKNVRGRQGSPRACSPSGQDPSAHDESRWWGVSGEGEGVGRVGDSRGTVPVTEALIAAARSPRGGWTRESLALLGVPWPPPKGWRRSAGSRKIPRADAERLLRGSV